MEIFKRDNFRCHYCGTSPVSGVLHVDHVRPKAEGGTDDPSNLITACADCNLGKGAVPLERKKFKGEFASEAEKEHAEQIREYLKVQRDIAAAKGEVIDEVLRRWQERMGDWHYTLPGVLPRPLKDFGLGSVLEAVDIVSRYQPGSGVKSVKYLCGIFRNWREKGPPSPFTVAECEEDEPDDELAPVIDGIARAIEAYWEFKMGRRLRAEIRDLLRESETEYRVGLKTWFRLIDEAAKFDYSDTDENETDDRGLSPREAAFIDRLDSEMDAVLPESRKAHGGTNPNH